MQPMVTNEKKSPKLNRYSETSEDLLERELLWWSTFGESEESFFWALENKPQPISRLRYIDDAIEFLSDCSSIVDFGCGNGWLSRQLAKTFSKEIIGIDFSESQIELAKKNTPIKNIKYKKIDHVSDLPTANGYIFHGVLHHMDSSNILKILSIVNEHAESGTKVVIIEPCCFPGVPVTEEQQKTIASINEILSMPQSILHEKGLSVSEKSQTILEQVNSRWWGELPYGPSPMERPFEYEELCRLSDHFFNVISSKLVQYLPASQALASQIAIHSEYGKQELQDHIGSLLKDMDLLESSILKSLPAPDTGWYMNMTLATTR